MMKECEHTPHQLDSKEISSYILAGVALTAILVFKVLAALIAGLLIHQIVHMLAKRVHIGRLHGKHAKFIAVTIISILVVTLIIASTYGLVVYISNSNGNLRTLMDQMAKIIDEAHDMLPPSIADFLPDGTENIRDAMSGWLRQHSAEIQNMGARTGRVIVHIIIGMVIGAMTAMREALPRHKYAPLAGALAERARVLSDSFRTVVFAQIRIAGINAFFTAIYLAAILPYAGVKLPFVKIMITLTFVFGLIPIIGNIMSNIVIVTVSLSQTVYVALASLAFLVIIHKLEYFLNAHIVGTCIRAHAWELLCSMLIMEAAFGIEGLIAAPFYYAYLKKELWLRRMV